MKHFLSLSIALILLLFSIELYSQTYLNVLYGDNSKKTIEMNELSKITFEDSNIKYLLTSSSITTETLSYTSNITLAASNGSSALPVELIFFNAE